MSRPVIIQVTNLVGGYGDEVILDRLSFDVYEGEIFVILGGSGCGKSTLLKHLIGLLRPVSGRVLVDGEDLCVPDERKFRNILRKIGVLYQSGALFGLHDHCGKHRHAHQGVHDPQRGAGADSREDEAESGRSRRLWNAPSLGGERGDEETGGACEGHGPQPPHTLLRRAVPQGSIRSLRQASTTSSFT